MNGHARDAARRAGAVEKSPLMSLAAPSHISDFTPARERGLLAPATAVLIGLVIFLALNASGIVETWTLGLFPDTDDAMRMTQIREWMAGKAWFDVSVSRMSPPDGFRTHWSHVIDVPIAALIHLFGLVFDPVHAERAARIAFPILCFAAILVVLVALGRRMVGPLGGLTAGALAPLAFFAAQFRPGRIDHHAPQLLLLALIAYALARSFEPRGGRWSALGGACAGLSLAISVENLPFLVAAAAAYAAAPAVTPARARASVAFGLSFALSTLAAWAAFADPLAGPVCDALSSFHVSLAMLGGFGLAGLCMAAGRLSAPQRWIGLAALGGATLALTKFAFPDCLRDPLAAVPPIAVEFWLSRVTEAEPWLTALRHQPAVAAAVGAPILLAIPATLLAARARLRAEFDDDAMGAAPRWLAMAGLLAVGAAATFWQVRAGGSTQIPVLMGAAAAVVGAERLARRRGLTPLWAIFAALPFAGLFWVALTPEPAPAAPAQTPALDCLAPASTAGLDALAPGLVLTSLDPGSYLLAQTKHSVLGGAYHRNARGNVDALEAMLGDPAKAREIIRARGVEYVAMCADLVDMKLYARWRPTSLAARLIAGEAPDWLAPVATEGPWRVYRPR